MIVLDETLADRARRRFLAGGAQAGLTVLAGLAARPGPARADGGPAASGALEARLAGTIEAYDAQGNHRTGTRPDAGSAEWLAGRLSRLGIARALEPFALSRIDPRSCHLHIADRRIEGVAAFDMSFTGPGGVRGRLGPLGSEAEIGLAETEPTPVTAPGGDVEGALLARIRRSGHQAVVLVTRGDRPGLSLVNAGAFGTPSGPPTLQVSSVEGDWLKLQARQREQARVTVEVARVPAQACNVTGHVRGAQPSLAPLVISTPRSGWWQCAGERGGGLACWLETARMIAASEPARDCHFVAFSGHELGHLGGDDYLRRHRGLARRAHAWIHFGANLGVPGQANLLQPADDDLELRAAAAMRREGLAVNRTAARGAPALGEAGLAQRNGGRYLAIVCDSDLFHNPADRWPDALDLALLARYARAFGGVAVDLARSPFPIA